jgi:glycerophosphoryl diester phosphodiesterase
MNKITTISHRGRLCGEEDNIPGNTLRAFGVCLDACPEVPIEMDVRFTRGGLLLIAHDNLLQSFTGGNGPVNQIKSPEDLKHLYVKSQGQETDETIPELEDVLHLFDGRGTIHLELKYGPDDPPGLLDAVLKTLKNYPSQSVIISSFNHAALHAVPANYPIGILTNSMPVNLTAYLQQLTAHGRPLSQIAFHPDIWTLTDEALTAANEAGITVNAYTVPPEMFEWACANSVNIITDYPLAAMKLLSS